MEDDACSQSEATLFSHWVCRAFYNLGPCFSCGESGYCRGLRLCRSRYIFWRYCFEATGVTQANSGLEWSLRNRVGSALTVLLVAILIAFAFFPQHQGKWNHDLREMIEQQRIESVEVTDAGTAKKIVVPRAQLQDRQFLVALTTTTCTSVGGTTDVRTGIVFYGQDHQQVRSFFYGPDGENGQLDGRPCRLSPGLYRWAKKVLER
jgi:hypothetical protein